MLLNLEGYRERFYMTTSDERTKAVFYAREFLRSLLNPKATPKVPKKIREQARRALRHFPNSRDMEAACKANPDVFSEVYGAY